MGTYTLPPTDGTQLSVTQGEFSDESEFDQHGSHRMAGNPPQRCSTSSYTSL